MTTIARTRALQTGLWAGEIVYVVGTGPSSGTRYHSPITGDVPEPEDINQPSPTITLAEIDRLAALGSIRVIAVNHAVHEVPHADILFSKDLSLFERQDGCPSCCVDVRHRPDIVCVYSVADLDMERQRSAHPDLVVLKEWPRSGVGQCGPWPSTIADRDPLVTCGNSGVGALCLADLLCAGHPESVIHLIGLDMQKPPYSTWAQWFSESGYATAVRTRVVTHGATSLDPRGIWGRADGPVRVPEDRTGLYERLWRNPVYRRANPWRRAFNATRHLFRPGQKMLDAGCGTGRAGAQFAALGLNVVLSDIADNAVDPEIVERLHLPFVQRSLSDLRALGGLSRLPQPAYDWVFCADVLEHVDPIEVAASLDGLRACASRAVIQIALFPDLSIERELGIDAWLHLTVRPREWWMDRLERRWARVEDVSSAESWLTVVCSAEAAS